MFHALILDNLAEGQGRYLAGVEGMAIEWVI